MIQTSRRLIAQPHLPSVLLRRAESGSQSRDQDILQFAFPRLSRGEPPGGAKSLLTWRTDGALFPSEILSVF